MKLKKTAPALVAVVLAICSTSCKTPQDVSYFQDTADIVNIVNRTPIKVRPEDKLSIIVKSKDAAVADLFNLGIYTTRYASTGSMNNLSRNLSYVPSGGDGVAYYTVDPTGCIDFPVLGKLKVEGMTRSELAGFIKGELMGRDLVKDPTVTVEFINTGVNIIGHVKNPGRYDINVDNLNILEAISMAGDLDIDGKRKNVKVLREENGKVKTYSLDLTNLEELAKSPAYSLQQNDIIYVDANDKLKRQTTVNGNNALSTSFWISVASLVTTAVTTIGVFINK